METSVSRVSKFHNLMGFFNKPGKATRGFVNKVVRELDRVFMEKDQFQREYTRPTCEPRPTIPFMCPEPESKLESKVEVDPEYPRYYKRNKLGFIIPLPIHYREILSQFIIFDDDRPTTKIHKQRANEMIRLVECGSTYEEYLINVFNSLKGGLRGSMYIIKSNELPPPVK